MDLLHCTAQAHTLCKEPFQRHISCYSESQVVLLQLPPSRDGGLWLNVIRQRVMYSWRSESMSLRENCITSGSPLYRGLARAIYILCIEHLRILRFSWELNWDLLHCRRTLYAKSHSDGVLVAIRNLRLCCYKRTISSRFLVILLRVPRLEVSYGFLKPQGRGMVFCQVFLLSPVKCTVTELQ